MARPRGFLSWFTSPSPDVAIEIASGQVCGVGLAAGTDEPTVARQASAPLPTGALVPALNAHNVSDRGAVHAAVRQVLEQLGRPKRVALVVPDPVARLSIVRFDSVPAKRDDLEQLVRFQVKKAAPFPIEAAHLSVVPGRALDGGAREFVVAVARRDVVEEYEAACAEAGAHAGVVDLATCSLLNLAMAGRRRADGEDVEDWMLVHVTSAYSTVAIVRGDTPILFRNLVAEAEGPLTQAVHQSAMYYEDRLEGRGFRRVVVAGRGAGSVEFREVEQIVLERLHATVEPLDLGRVVRRADRIEIPAALGPTIGLAMREAC
jgi:Tfp pilus assembly PilM family ATPase